MYTSTFGMANMGASHRFDTTTGCNLSKSLLLLLMFQSLCIFTPNSVEAVAANIALTEVTCAIY